MTTQTHKPGSCPYCHSTDIDGAAFDIWDYGEHGTFASQEVACNACDCTWVEEYRYTEYRAINGPPQPAKAIG